MVAIKTLLTAALPLLASAAPVADEAHLVRRCSIEDSLSTVLEFLTTLAVEFGGLVADVLDGHLLTQPSQDLSRYVTEIQGLEQQVKQFLDGLDPSCLGGVPTGYGPFEPIVSAGNQLQQYSASQGQSQQTIDQIKQASGSANKIASYAAQIAGNAPDASQRAAPVVGNLQNVLAPLLHAL